jgi:hypothetical protein
VEIEDQQYPCSNRDQLSVRLIQAVFIPSPLLAEKQAPVLCLLCYVVWCLHKMTKLDMIMEPKITCSKIFIFQPILDFQKHFHLAVHFSVTAQFSKYIFLNLARFSQEG